MKRILVTLGIAILALFNQILSAQVLVPADGRKPEETKEYFTGELTGFQLAPSAKGVAYLKFESNKWVLYWDNIYGGRETRVSTVDQPNVVDFRWVGDDALVYSIGEGAIGTELHRFETFTKVYNRLTSTPVWIKFLDSHCYSRGTTLIIRDANDVVSAKAYAIQPGMRELKHIASGHGVNWVDGIGNGATYFMKRSEESTQFVRCSVLAEEKLGSVRGLCSLKGLALASKADNVAYMLSDLNRENVALVTMDMSTGMEKEIIYEKKGSTISKVLFSFSTGQPVMVWYDGVEQGFESIDADFTPVLSAILERLPSTYGFDVVHSDLSANVWLVSIMNAEGGRSYFHYNVSNRELKAFGKPVAGASVAAMTELIPTRNGDNLLVRFYAPEELTSKSMGVLVFRDAPWNSKQPGAIDALIQALVHDGMIVADVDLSYSELSRKKLVYSGYDQLIDRVLEQIPLIHKTMMSNFSVANGVLAVLGEGIGCRAALRVCAEHTSIVLRSVLIQPSPELKPYVMSQFPIEMDTKAYVMGFGDAAQTIATPYVAREPLFVYAYSQGTYFDENVNPVVKKFIQAGRSPESYLVGSGMNQNFSSSTVQKLSDKVVEYLHK